MSNSLGTGFLLGSFGMIVRGKLVRRGWDSCVMATFIYVILLWHKIIHWLMNNYNASQSLAQRVRETHSNIMVSMKKRVDLANKLVDIARNYGDHEKLTHISVAQSESMGSALAASNQQISNVLSGVMAMARAYPVLANQTYQLLMQQLEQIEADLQKKRETYNSVVRSDKTAAQMFHPYA